MTKRKIDTQIKDMTTQQMIDQINFFTELYKDKAQITKGGSFNNKISLATNNIINDQIFYKKYLKYKKKYLDLKYSL